MIDPKLGKGHVIVSAVLDESAPAFVPLSVELFGLAGTGYAQGLVGDAMSVTPGDYFVQLTLPDGQKVASGKTLTVTAGEAGLFDFERSVLSEFLTSNFVPRRASVIASDAAASTLIPTDSVEWNARIWRGALADEWMELHTAGGDVIQRLVGGAESTVDKEFRLYRMGMPTTVLFLEQGTNASAYVIPFDEHEGVPVPTAFWWHTDVGGRLSLEYDFGNPRTNAFLRFVRKGERAVARDLSLRGLVDQAERLAQGKSESPIGAVLGLYVLLRINELEGFETWTANLYEFFPWLPDAFAIRVEYLARSAKHAEAVALLRTADLKGGPWFRSGMNYLLERLGLYVEIAANGESSELGLEPSVVASMKRMQVGLQRLGRYLDPSETICTFHDLPVGTVSR